TTVLATGTADASGVWHLTVGTPLTVGTHNIAARATDLAGNQATSGTLAVTIASTFRVVGFASNPSGFDVTLNRTPNLGDLNLYDGPDVAVETPDIVVHANTANVDVKGSFTFNTATNTLTFVKTGGILANDTYTVTLKSSAVAFHDQSGNLL